MYDVDSVSAGSGFEVRRSEDGGSFDRLSPNVDGNGDAPSCFATYPAANDPSGYFYSQQRFNAHFWDPTTTPSTEVIFIGVPFFILLIRLLNIFFIIIGTPGRT